MSEANVKMISIWLMCAIAVGLYGLIILGMGLYYEMHPEADQSALSALNPSLWWGAIMVVAAVLLFLADRAGTKRDNAAKK